MANDHLESSISGGDAPAEEAVTTQPRRRRLFTRFGVELLFVLALAVFMYFNFQTVAVSGRSMVPTFHTGQRLLVSRAYWLVGGIKDGDVVVLKDIGPSGTSADAPPGAYIIKRVNKMGGEQVDWKLVPQNYAFVRGPYIVPEGDIYVLGDNLPESEDSRRFGPRPMADVLGKVLKR